MFGQERKKERERYLESVFGVDKCEFKDLARQNKPNDDQIVKLFESNVQFVFDNSINYFNEEKFDDFNQISSTYRGKKKTKLFRIIPKRKKK